MVAALPPFAAAHFLFDQILPGPPVHAWSGSPPGLRADALRIARSARMETLLAASLLHREPDLPLPENGIATAAARDLALAAFAWVEGTRVLDLLERTGLAPIALKGADLSARAYPVAWKDLPDRAYLRVAADLDVLVPAGAARASGAAAMLSAGFTLDPLQEAAHHARFCTSGDAGAAFSVELHEDLFDRPHGLALDLDAMRARAVRITTAGGDLRRVLAPEDAFLHVAGHAVYSDGLATPIAAVRSILDLYALCAAVPIDPAIVAGRATQSGLAPAVHLACAWGERLLPNPPETLGSIRAGLAYPRGMRAGQGRRRVIAAAEAALRCEPAHGAATWSRAMLASSVGAAARMILEGARRRTR